MNGGVRRARLLGVALLGMTFVAGALSGAALERVLSSPEPVLSGGEGGWRRGPRGGPPRESGVPPDIFDELGITPEQRQEIDAILQRRIVETGQFWEQYGPLLQAIVDSTRLEIREVLTPEQRAEYDRRRMERRRFVPGVVPQGSPGHREDGRDR